MNLTLKHMFKFGAVCACALALSATAATNYVADSFEVSDGGANGLLISEYKIIDVDYTDPNNHITNFSWFAESGDASAIVTNDAAYAAYSGDGPITGGTAELVLNLETEGNTLSRTCGVKIADSVYVDTLIKFTPSEDEPTVNMSGVKIALYVDASSNLVVKSSFGDHLGTPYVTNTVTSVSVDPARWYRLTLEVKDIGLGFVYGTRVRVDGEAISHDTNAYTDDGSLTVGGEWFANVVRGTAAGGDTIEKISFQGTGMLDELVVTDTAPTFAEPTAVMLTLMSSGPGSVTFKVADAPVTEVESGTEVRMTVGDWYQMGEATATDASFTTSYPITEDQIQSRTTTFSADNACTVTVATAYLSGDYPLGGGAFLNLAPLAQWALTYGYGQDAVEADAGSYLDGYVLNVSTNVAATAELVITDINVEPAADTTTITVAARNDDDAVKFNALNGVVNVYTNAVLDGTFGLSDSFDVTASTEADTTVVVTNNISGLFMKVKVELE